jgi:hypothetical protein
MIGDLPINRSSAMAQNGKEIDYDDFCENNHQSASKHGASRDLPLRHVSGVVDALPPATKVDADELVDHLNSRGIKRFFGILFTISFTRAP